MKTISLKKVSAVAVASLGFGLLSVVPAHAADAYTSAATTATHYATVGTPITTTVTIAGDAGSVLTNGTLTATMTAAPTGSTAAASWTSTGIEAPFAAGGTTANTHPTTYSGNVATIAADPDATGVALTAAKRMGTLSFTPLVAGTYTITLTLNAAFGSGAETNGTITVYAAGLAYALGDGAPVTPATTGNGIAGPANTVTVKASTDASNTRALVSVSGAGATINSNAGTALAAGTTSTIVASGGQEVVIVINTPTAGTVTVSQFYESGNGTGIYASTASKTVTITVGAAALNGTISVANSTSIRDTTIASDDAAWSSISADETTAVTAEASASLERAVIKLVLKDTLTNLMPNATGVSVTITGPGLLAIGTTQPTAAVGRAVSTASLASGTGTAFVSVYSDGTPGIGTITISVGTTVVATETVSFYGTPSKYIATSNIVAAANSVTSTDVVTVCAVDSAGIPVPSSLIYAFSGDAAVATVETSGTTGAATTAAGTSYADHRPVAAAGCYSFDVTGVSQKTKSDVVLTFGNAATIATSTVTATAKVLVGEVAATTVALTTDKASYKPGEAVVLTLAFRDSIGRPVAYGPGTDTLAAALTSSVSLGSSALFGTANISKTGTTVTTVYAPLSAGPVTISGTTGANGTYLVSGAQGGPLTATFTVAQNADIAAISTAIDALNAKIVALNALIAKIMKKLGVK